jgi:hypothetical protein
MAKRGRITNPSAAPPAIDAAHGALGQEIGPTARNALPYDTSASGSLGPVRRRFAGEAEGTGTRRAAGVGPRNLATRYCSSLIATRTCPSRSRGTSCMLCAVRACSRMLRMTSSSVAPRVRQSQSTPMSRHVYVFAIGPLPVSCGGWRGLRRQRQCEPRRHARQGRLASVTPSEPRARAGLLRDQQQEIRRSRATASSSGPVGRPGRCSTRTVSAPGSGSTSGCGGGRPAPASKSSGSWSDAETVRSGGPVPARRRDVRGAGGVSGEADAGAQEDADRADGGGVQRLSRHRAARSPPARRRIRTHTVRNPASGGARVVHRSAHQTVLDLSSPCQPRERPPSSPLANPGETAAANPGLPDHERSRDPPRPPARPARS